MDNATAPQTLGPTIRPEEATHFGKLAAEWWDPKGSSKMLHRLNPVRLGFVREAIDAHWGGAAAALKPLAGKRALAGELASLELGQFDLVTCMEVLEHVSDKPAFVAGLAASLAPGGLLILSTPNRTPQSRLLLVGAAELVGAIPRGTHHWGDFVTPLELHGLLADAALAMGNPRGIAWSPGRGLHLSDDTALNYIVSAVQAPRTVT
jgi:2-polyprenyl-6-hydroxyphenyl methylase/3-demethylubiquinone-9 3-methyltransferase